MRQRPNIHHVTLHGTGRGFVRVPVRTVEADCSEVFPRTRAHIERGIEGKACTCAHSEGALEHLGGDGWEFTDNRAYKLFKNKKGQLTKAVVYQHGEGKFQEKYDRLGKRAMLKAPDCEGIVTLNPPPRYTPTTGSRAPYPPSKKDGSGIKRKRQRARGSLARLERVGIKI